ncbi:MAG: phosphatase PAP2 family protein [Clostridia bacterium]|nr:phosphatase PAP2 family protein [Clostridia bacterium]
MEILYWFKSIRDAAGTGLLTKFFEFITFFGHELIPIALICILYWCANKKLAYKIGFSFFLSGLMTQCLKITFRIDRPWIKDPSFTPVEGAMDEATSYSFPSGHTQAATSVYGSLALTFKKAWLKILCIALFVIVGISRLYLGVHTPLDVGVSMALTLTITILVFKFTDKLYENRKADIWVSLVMVLVSIFTLVYTTILFTNGTISHDAASDCIKSGGAGLAFAIGYYLERHFIDFDTKAKSIWIQVLKVAAGLGLALGLKSGLKAILGETLVADGIRYFVLVAVIIVIYPWILKMIQKKRQ